MKIISLMFKSCFVVLNLDYPNYLEPTPDKQKFGYWDFFKFFHIMCYIVFIIIKNTIIIGT